MRTDTIYKGIMVYIEIQNGKVLENSLELLGASRDLVDQLGKDTKVFAALMGGSVSVYADELIRYGADVVVAFDDDRLALYQPDTYSHVFSQMIIKYCPEIVLVGASACGSELAPTVALKLKTGLASHCVDLRINENGKMIAVVPAFGGKVLGDIICPSSFPQMASLKAGIMQKRKAADREGKVEAFSCDIGGFGGRMKAVGIHMQPLTGKPLQESEIIVGGGFGIGDKEGWQQLEELASLLNGVTGCTRAALDEGWTGGEHTMIGTSGIAVRPKLYINAGVSGAAHHTCGVKDAEIIISINKDNNAPIFNISDYCVISDYENIIPLLIQKLKSMS